MKGKYKIEKDLNKKPTFYDFDSPKKKEMKKMFKPTKGAKKLI